MYFWDSVKSDVRLRNLSALFSSIEWLTGQHANRDQRYTRNGTSETISLFL